MAGFVIDFDESDLKRVEHTLRDISNGAPRAIKDAINRTAVTVRKRLVDRLAEELPVQKTGIRRQTRIVRATAKVQRGKVELRGGPIPLIRYRARKGKAGATADIGEGREVFKDSFIQRMPNGHRGVFKRKQAATWANGKRLPIRQLYGPSALSVWREGIGEEITTDAQVLLVRNLNSRTRSLLEQAGRRRAG